jgi:hypothetical protein
MHALGLILIAVGFTAGSLVAVLDPEGIDWLVFVPCLVVGAAGVALVQIAMRRVATDVTRIAANFEALDSRLRTIVAQIRALDETKDSLDIYAVPDRIDEAFPADILAFVEARESILHAWGAEAYAEVMTHFAAAERYLNRVWSCSADGWIDEAHEYIGRAREQFEEALARFEARAAKAGPAAS